jgi:hypothetical protein
MFSSSKRRDRKLILREIRRNALYLASLVGDDRYPRKFTVMRGHDGKTYSLTRLKRLKRPLWLGSDGYIYRVDEVWDYLNEAEGFVRRAKLKRRDFAGLERVNDVLILAIDDIFDKTPLQPGIIAEM